MPGPALSRFARLLDVSFPTISMWMSLAAAAVLAGASHSGLADIPNDTGVYEPEPKEPRDDGGCNNDKKTSDPIHLAFGDFYHEQIDVTIPGRSMPLAFKRTYRHRSGLWSTFVHSGLFDGSEAVEYEAIARTQPLGMNWDHGLNIRVRGRSWVEVENTGAQGCEFIDFPYYPQVVEFYPGDGRRDEFYLFRGSGLPQNYVYYYRAEYDGLMRYQPATGVFSYIAADGSDLEFLPYFDIPDDAFVPDEVFPPDEPPCGLSCGFSGGVCVCQCVCVIEPVPGLSPSCYEVRCVAGGPFPCPWLSGGSNPVGGVEPGPGDFLPGSASSAYPPIGGWPRAVDGGRIARRTDRHGNSQWWNWEVFDTSTAACFGGIGDQLVCRLASVEDDLGNELVFTYDDCYDPSIDAYPYLIRGMSHPQSGRQWLFEYEFDDEAGVHKTPKLTGIVLPAIETTAAFPLPAVHARFPSGTSHMQRRWEYGYYSNQSVGYHKTGGQMSRITDPNGDVIVENFYSPVHENVQDLGTLRLGRPPRWSRYPARNRVVRQIYGGDEYNYTVTAAGQPKGGVNIYSGQEYTVWINDRSGAVVEQRYAPNVLGNPPGFAPASIPALMEQRTYLDRAGSAVGESYVLNGTRVNMPPTSSDVAVRSWEYDREIRRDSNGLAVMEPGSVRYEYAPESSETSDPRKTKRVLRRISGSQTATSTDFVGNATSEAVEDWNYLLPLGAACGCGNGTDFATNYRDANGNITAYEFDPANGNLMGVFAGLPPTGSGPVDWFTATLAGDPALVAIAESTATSVTKYQYNPFGQVARHVHPRTTLSGGIAHAREDSFEYGTDVQADPEGFGRLIQRREDVAGQDIVTQYGYDLAGNRVLEMRSTGAPTRPFDATIWIYNQDGALVREECWDGNPGSPHDSGSSYPDISNATLVARIDYFYDATGYLTRVEVLNLDEFFVPVAGNPTWTTVYQHDSIGARLAQAAEISPAAPPAEDALNKRIDVLGTQSGFISLTENEWAVTRYEYDGNRNLVLVEHPEAVDGRDAENWVAMDYDGMDRLVQRSQGVDGASAPQVVEYERDISTGLVTKTKVLGSGSATREWVSQYDMLLRPVERVDPIGTLTRARYDRAGNILSQEVEAPVFVPSSGQSEVRTMVYSESEFDALDRAVEHREYIFDPAAATAFAVPSDPATNDPALPKAVTSTLYNANSSVRALTVPVGDAPGLAPTAGRTDFYYDTMGRLASQMDSLGNSVSYDYDPDGNVVRTVRADTRAGVPDEVFITKQEYDPLNRMISHSAGVTNADPDGNLHTYEYDSRGNLVWTQDPNGHGTRYEYDGLGRVTRERRMMTDPGNPEIQTIVRYDDSSRVKWFEDDNLKKSFFTYDGMGRVRTHTLPDGAVYTWDYNQYGDLDAWSDPRGTSVSYVLDAKGRVTSQTGTKSVDVVGSLAETYAYDGLDRLVLAQNESAKVTMAYDSRGLLLRETQNHDAPGFPAASDRLVQNAYDTAGNERRTVYPGGREVWRAFDELNRLAALHNDAAGTQPVLSYTYAGPGRVASRTSGNGVVAKYAYNGFEGAVVDPADEGVGRIAGVKHALGATTIAEHTLVWDAAGNKVADRDITPGFDPRRHRSFGYDADDRLISTGMAFPGIGSGTTTASTAYTLDGLHNRLAVTGDNDAGALVGSYLPDELNQYEEVPGFVYIYDANGNLITYHEPCIADLNGDFIVDMGDAATFATAYSQQDPSADINGDGIVDFGDVSAWQAAFTALNGQICYNVQLRYDHRNRLRMWTEMSTSAARHGSYQYDALSRRVRKEADTDGDGAIDDTAYFIYAGQADWQLIEEWDGAGVAATRTRDYAYGNYIDELVHSRDTTGPTPVSRYHHQDDLFSIVATTDASGAVVERFQYGDYGDRRVLDGAGNTREYSLIGLRHGFTGQLHDDESGLVLMRHRHLNPADGKWVQRDPEGYVDTANLSTYVSSRPAAARDPFGTDDDDYKEHTKGARKSTEGPHQTGQARLKADQARAAARKAAQEEAAKKAAARKTQLKNIAKKNAKKSRGFGLGKLIGPLAVGSCVSAASASYQSCLDNMNTDYESCLRQAMSPLSDGPMRGPAGCQKKYGVEITEEEESECNYLMRLDAASCAAEFAAASAACLLPFAIPGIN